MDVAQAIIRRLRFRDLRLLVALGEQRNLQRVAGEFGVTQPAVTKMLQEVERTLACTLFDRNTRRMVPTPAGELMIRHARTMLSNLDLIGRQIDAARRGLSGVRRVGVLPYASPLLLPQVTRTVAQTAPEIRLSIVEDMTDRLIMMLTRGELDVAIGRVSARFSSDVLKQTYLYGERGSIVAGAGHPLARRRGMNLADTVAFPWVLPPDGSPTRVAIDAMFARAGLPAPVAAVEIFSVSALLNLLPESTSLSVLPQSVARYHARHSSAIVVLPLDTDCDLPSVSLYSQKIANNDPAVTTIESIIRRVAKRSLDRAPQR